MGAHDHNDPAYLRRFLSESRQRLNVEENAHARARLEKSIATLEADLAKVLEREGTFLKGEGEIVPFLNYLDLVIEEIKHASSSSSTRSSRFISTHKLMNEDEYLGGIYSKYVKGNLLENSLVLYYVAQGIDKTYTFTRTAKYTDLDKQWEYFTKEAIGYVQRLQTVWQKKL